MSTLTQLFTNIADAIRSHKDQEHQQPIAAEDFPDEIEAIKTGELTEEEYQVANDDVDDILTNTNIPSTTINIIENGLYDIRDYASANVAVISNTVKVLDGMKLGHSLSVPENLDISAVVDMSYMFTNCSNFTSVPNLNTSRATNMFGMFYYCNNLTSIPNLDTSKVTNMSYMFIYCNNLALVSNLDTGNVTDMANMFFGCRKLTTIPNFDTSNVTKMTSMVSYCINLISIPNLDTSNVTNSNDMFNGCYNLTTVPNLDINKVTNMSGMFSFCNNLIDIPFMSASKVNNMAYTFRNCLNLSNNSLANILGICATSNVRAANKTLKYCGLSQDQANICVNLSNWSVAEAAGWTTGY